MRFEEVLANNTSSAVTQAITIRGDLGSDTSTAIIATGSGDTSLTIADPWLISDDGTTLSAGDPRLAFVFRDAASASSVSSATLSGDDLSVTYPVTLAAGETAVLMHFAAQSRNASDIATLASAIATNPAAYTTGMSPALQHTLINFTLPPVTVTSSVTATLTDAQDNLTLTGSAPISGTGNAYDNEIRGNSAANTLSGLDGDDVLLGFDGGDTLNGGNGHDYLDGEIGGDRMDGGAGNDTYLVDSAADIVIEGLNGGTDLIVSSVDIALAANVENLLLASGALNGTGNDLANFIAGNAANNRLSGGEGAYYLDGLGGADRMVGGTGNDSYVVNLSADQVVEIAGGGIDTVMSKVSYTLSDNVERLTLTGSGNVSGTGNSVANVIKGNRGHNTLSGGGGNDTLIGGAGNDKLKGEFGRDTLAGGIGDDIYQFRSTGGTFRIEDELGSDTISARYASAGADIDLGLGATSRIGTDTIVTSSGARISNDLDLVFLQDLSGSFGDDIATVRTLVPRIVSSVKEIAPLAKFGLASFVDKPTGGFGGGATTK